MDLDGLVAIVTGAGAGLGLAEAEALSAAGARVVLNDLPGAADEAAERINQVGGAATVVAGDVGESSTAEALMRAALDLGSLDIVVNNAGVLRDKMLFSLTDEDWDLVVKVHLRGHFLLTRNAAAYWREMSKARDGQVYGRIINTASEAFLFGPPGQANYAAAKAGITALTMSAARALGRYGVTANAIRPRAGTRLTLTPELRAAMERARAARGETGSDAPISQMDALAPEKVAPLVVYLCTDAAGDVNGRDFIVGGDEISLCTLVGKEKSIFREGGWTLDALDRVFPQSLGQGIRNPMPRQEKKE